MTNPLRDRVAQALEAAKLQGLGNTAQADATLAEVQAYRRERAAEFEAALQTFKGALAGWIVGEEVHDLDEAEAALRKLWLEE